MPHGLDMLRDVFGDDFTNAFRKPSELNLTQYLEMKDLTFIIHLPTPEDEQNCYKGLSEKFQVIDQKDLYLKVAMRYPDASLTELKLSEMNMEETTKEQVRKLQQIQEKEYLEKVKWLEIEVKDYNGDLIILSGDNLIKNGILAVEKEKEEVKKGIEELDTFIEEVKKDRKRKSKRS